MGLFGSTVSPAEDAVVTGAIQRDATLEVGRARRQVSIVRVTFWGALPMAITAGVGARFGMAS